jgi:hypothetical protein
MLAASPRASLDRCWCQHEDAVELGVLLGLGPIDDEMAGPAVLKAATASIADQRLVAPGELARQRRQDDLAIGAILLRTALTP